MKRLRWISILLASQLFLFNSYAVESRGGAWLGTFTDTSISKSFSVWAETQLRYSFYIGGMGQTLYRLGFLQKNLGEKHQLGYLYAFIQTSIIKEHRFTFQHVMKYGKFIGQSFAHRMRIEGRFPEKVIKNSVRLRYLIRADQQTDSKFKFVFWDELFINLTREFWTGNRSINANRLFVGLKRGIGEGNRVEFGYLNQFIPRNKIKVMQHLFVFYYFYKS